MHDIAVELTEQFETCRAGYLEQAEELQKAIVKMGASLARTLAPIFKQLMLGVTSFVIALQREVLYQSLPSWMPERLAQLIARHCPVRWLPDLTPEGLAHIARSARSDEA